MKKSVENAIVNLSYVHSDPDGLLALIIDFLTHVDEKRVCTAGCCAIYCRTLSC